MADRMLATPFLLVAALLDLLTEAGNGSAIEGNRGEGMGMRREALIPLPDYAARFYFYLRHFFNPKERFRLQGNRVLNCIFRFMETPKSQS